MRPRYSSGVTLVEVLVAGLILVLSVLATVNLQTSSARQIEKVRARIIAVNLAASMVEELRSRRLPDRASSPPAKATELPHLAAIVNAHRRAVPADGLLIDRMLGGITCGATYNDASTPPTVQVDVTWTEAGAPQSFVSRARVGSTT